MEPLEIWALGKGYEYTAESPIEGYYLILS